MKLGASLAATIALPLAVGLGSCQDYLFEQKCPEGVTESEVTVPAAAPTPADILFVVDNSGSMEDEQQNLAANFSAFINQIAGTGDYRIAIVTTDLSSNNGEQRGFVDLFFSTTNEYRYWDPLQSDYQSCQSFQPEVPHGCFRFDPTDPNPIIDSNTIAADRQIELFQKNVLVGSCGSGEEAGLQAMRVALEADCNQNFLRENANLVVVFVSDEEDFEPNGTNTQISSYVDFLTNLKQPSQLRVAAIVGSVDGEAARCNQNGGACGSLCEGPTPPRGSLDTCNNTIGCGDPDEYCNNNNRCENKAFRYWDDTNCGWCSYYAVEDCCSALAGGRYVAFARAIEDVVVSADPAITRANCSAPRGQAAACLIDSICQENFSQTLERIATELVLTDSYTLNPPATNPAGVAVTLRGGRFGEAGVDLDPATEFTVNSDGTTLRIIAGDKKPSTGESVELFYVSEIVKQPERRGACGGQ